MKSVNGLILAGGYSTRMGMDKSHIDYHGKPQYAYLHELLTPLVDEVFISCRKEQSFELPVPRIEDVYEDIGPVSGILSAFNFNASCAWLMVPVDLPFVDEGVIMTLISQRDPLSDATFFVDPESGFIEPLLALYEPSIYPLLKNAVAEQQLSLNKILQNCRSNKIIMADKKVLRSINTMEELKGFKSEK